MNEWFILVMIFFFGSSDFPSLSVKYVLCYEQVVVRIDIAKFVNEANE